jgi:hypothetical protein
MRRALVFLCLLLASCLTIEPQDGALRCSSAHECPTGYTCASDQTCWRNGHVPGVGGAGVGGAGDAGAVECQPGFHVCNGACASNSTPQTCGSSCTPCAPPNGGTATCEAGACGGQCPTGQKLCAGNCIPAGTACNGVCSAGTHLCGGLCSSNGDVNSCGSSCTPCPVPPNGAATCTPNGTCDFTCNAGYIRCGNGCSGAVFYRDADGDGWGDPNVTIMSCSEPTGYVANNTDCDDSNSNVFPGQPNWFSTPRANGSFDYNCDGRADLRWGAFGCGGSAPCNGTDGFAGMVPNCGGNHCFRYGWQCTAHGTACLTTACAINGNDYQTQQCH